MTFLQSLSSALLLLLSMTSFAADSPKTLDLAKAKQLAAKAAAFAQKKNWKMSIAIVNSEGNLIYFERMDGAFFGSIDAALLKAKSSAAFERPTKAFADDANQGKAGRLSLNHVVAVEGGLPIILNGKVVGAIGASGAHATEDEECAKAALE